MTLHDWRTHITAKGISQNEAVRLLNEAQAEIERPWAALRQVVDCPLCNGDGAYPPVYESPFSNVCECRKEARRVLGEEGEG